ncbi:MAG: ABC transporter ATP-binding protein [Acidimicrobiales bacterium]|nr:ABC transporter ATP-binding protein [Acidimicrobiales bacterium]
MPSSTPGLAIAGLRKAFGAVAAVDGVDLEVPGGQTIALLGPNGAGKSTTIDLVLGLAEPDAGTIEVFGRPPRAACDAGIVGAMLQTGGLLRELTVRELLSVMGSMYPRAIGVDEVVELAAIGELVDRRTHQLSGGETQRVRFALALVSDPDLLVLDEPTVAMDVNARHGFWTAMRGFASRGKTVLFATHYLDEADAWADRIVMLARGRIVADGSASEIGALVGSKVVRATLREAELDALRALPGVAAVARHGDTVELTCTDSDAALRALLAAEPEACDLEVRSAGIEAAFLALTGDVEPTVAPERVA